MTLKGMNGQYFLEYDGPRHKFITHVCRETFQRRLKHACEKSLREGPSQVEWELKKLRDLPKHESVVSVVGWFTADFLESAAIESVTKEIEKGKRKFNGWTGGWHLAVALHAGEQQKEVPHSSLNNALAELERTVAHPLDMVFLVSKEQVWRFDATH